MQAECKKEFISIITINKDHALEDENPKMYNLILFGLYYSPLFFLTLPCFLLLFIPAWEELYWPAMEDVSKCRTHWMRVSSLHSKSSSRISEDNSSLNSNELSTNKNTTKEEEDSLNKSKNENVCGFHFFTKSVWQQNITLSNALCWISFLP